MRIGRLLLMLASVMLAVGLHAGTVLAQDPADVRLDSAVRSLEMGPRETRTDLTVDLYNTTADRRLVKIELDDIPAGWDIAVWDRFFDFKVGEIVVEPPAPDDTGASQSLRLRVDLPDERPPAGKYSFGLRITSPDGSIEYDSARYTIIVPDPPSQHGHGRRRHRDVPRPERPCHQRVRVRDRHRQRHGRGLLLQPHRGGIRS